MAIINHDPANDGMFVELRRNQKVDLLGLLRDPDNPKVGRDVTLVGPGGVRLRLHEEMGQNDDPESRELRVVIVDALLEVSAGPTLELKWRDDDDSRAITNRWLSDFCRIADSVELSLPPLMVEGYIRHQAGDLRS